MDKCIVDTEWLRNLLQMMDTDELICKNIPQKNAYECDYADCIDCLINQGIIHSVIQGIESERNE